MNDVAIALLAAKTLISDLDEWCQGAEARSASQRSVKPTSQAATSWCAWGAMEAVVPGSVELEADQALIDASKNMYHGVPIVGINDDLGHADVMAMFDLAISMAMERKYER